MESSFFIHEAWARGWKVGLGAVFVVVAVGCDEICEEGQAVKDYEDDACGDSDAVAHEFEPCNLPRAAVLPFLRSCLLNCLYLFIDTGHASSLKMRKLDSRV